MRNDFVEDEQAMLDKDPLKFEIVIENGFRTWLSTFITMEGYRVEATQGQL